MKKLFVVLFLLLFCEGYSQRVTYPFGQSGNTKFTDSSKIFTIKSDTSIRFLAKTDFPSVARFDASIILSDGTFLYLGDHSTYPEVGIKGEINEILAHSNKFSWKTQTGSNTVAYLDSASGFNLSLGIYTGNGSGLTTLNASNISSGTVPYARLGIDSSTIHYVNRQDTISGNTWFSGVMKFITNIVDFAAGLTTTTMTSSGTATHNGAVINNSDVTYNGWSEQGGAIARDRYFRDTVLRSTLGGGVGTTVSVAHGISNINAVMDFDCMIKDDSSGKIIKYGPTSVLGGPQTLASSPYIDATNINLRITTTMTSLDDAVDTVKFYIRYTDYAR